MCCEHARARELRLLGCKLTGYLLQPSCSRAPLSFIAGRCPAPNPAALAPPHTHHNIPAV